MNLYPDLHKVLVESIAPLLPHSPPRGCIIPRTKSNIFTGHDESLSSPHVQPISPAMYGSHNVDVVIKFSQLLVMSNPLFTCYCILYWTENHLQDFLFKNKDFVYRIPYNKLFLIYTYLVILYISSIISENKSAVPYLQKSETEKNYQLIVYN